MKKYQITYFLPTLHSTYEIAALDLDTKYNTLLENIKISMKSIGAEDILMDPADKYNIKFYTMSPDNCVDPLTDPSFINKIPLDEVFRKAFLEDVMISSAYAFGGLVSYAIGKLMKGKKENVYELNKLESIIKREKLSTFLKNFGAVNGLAGSIISGLNLGIIYNNPVKIEGINALYYAAEHPEYANGTIIPYEISFWINLVIGGGVALARFGEFLRKVRGPKVGNYKNLAEVVERVK